MPTRGRKSGGRGTHGSTTKAGKMRSQNPMLWNPLERRKTKDGLLHKHKKKHRVPRVRNKHNYRVKVTIPFLIKIGKIRANPELRRKRRRY